MKKMLGIATGAVLACVGQVMAQTEASTVVGTPDSANMVIIEQGYEVMTPAVNAPANNGMEALPEDSGVEVAPAPENVPAVQNNNAPDMNNPQSQGSVTIDETVSEEVVN